MQVLCRKTTKGARILQTAISLALIGKAIPDKKVFEYYGHIHVYSPGTGGDNPRGLFFS